MIGFRCPSCGAQYTIQDAYGARMTICQSCNTRMIIPHAAPAISVRAVVVTPVAHRPAQASPPPPQVSAAPPRPRPPRPILVQVSARILHFPPLCCCCGTSSGVTEHFRASSTRTTGKKVIKTDTRSWTFPLCVPCRRWIGVQKTATALLGLFVALILLGILGVAVGINSIHKPAGVGYLAAGVVLLLLSPLACLGWLSKQKQADAIRPAPECAVAPVKYLGWHGSVHTFHFTNHAYCQRFQVANANKLLG